jgi:hypothetical protein
LIATLALTVLSATLCGALPEALKKTFESQFPAWAQVMGRPAKASDQEERIAVERTTNAVTNLFLIERKVKAVIQKEGERSWLTEVVWCGEGPDRCDDVWKRTDEQWRSDKNTANHTGYAVYRDVLRLDAATWSHPVPALETGRKKWDKGLCEDGLCFVVAAKDSSVARVALRSDSGVAWWDGGYILGRANEAELVHAYTYLLQSGRSLGSKATGGK